jgi:hypothetical protein
MDWATDHHVFIYLVLPLNGYPDELDARMLWLAFSFFFFSFLDSTTSLPIPFPALMFDDFVLWALVVRMTAWIEL